MDLRQECIDDPVLMATLAENDESSRSTYRQPLSIIRASRSEQGMKRVVGRNGEADGVDKEFGSNVEENKEKVEGGKAEHDVDLGYTSLLLKLIHVLIFTQLAAS
jgi:hypothetical protein